LRLTRLSLINLKFCFLRSHRWHSYSLCLLYSFSPFTLQDYYLEGPSIHFSDRRYNGFFSGIGHISVYWDSSDPRGHSAYFWCALSLTFSGKGTPWFFLPTEELVIRGLYRFVKNSIYVGACLILFGEALLFASAGLLIYASAWFIFFNFVVHGEEASLRRKYGESYEQYRKSVPRWIPRLKPFRGYISKSS